MFSHTKRFDIPVATESVGRKIAASIPGGMLFLFGARQVVYCLPVESRG
jgi:hypothetical protein